MNTTGDESPRKRSWGNLLLVLTALAFLSAWLAFTPPGLEGKVQAAGYAVCHQIESHSYSIGGKALPLCARCSGTFLGILVTLLLLYSKERRGGFPSRGKQALLLVFFLFFAADGINASLPLLGASPLYPPSNLLRLISGFLFGVTLANVVLPIWHQTLWVEQNPKPVLYRWRQLGGVLLWCAAIGALVVMDIAVLYYPIAILSTASIFLILAMVYSLLWCILLKKENSLHLFREGSRIFIAGLITAILQIGVMNLVRFTLSGSW